MTYPTATRPPLSPAAVKLLADCRKAKATAHRASVETARMPGAPTVTAARGEVQFIVHPTCLADWRRWLHDLGASDARGESTGAAMVVRCSYGGVPARVVGMGVPALYGERPPARCGRPAEVRP
jgi:hypothetical protein